MLACVVHTRIFCSFVIILSWLLCVNEAQECDDRCVLPHCYCEPLQIPGNLSPENVPQMITISFTGSITEENKKQLDELFPSSIKNPNGCSIAITLFVLGKFSDYCLIHKLYVRGHEVATQGFNASYSGEWTPERWKSQIADHINVLKKSAYIPLEDIQGVRAPLNRPGGDKQFDMMTEADFQYDSTLLMGPTNFEEEYKDKNLWPFTLYVPLEKLKCQTPDCPEKSYPNMWEIPITRQLVDGSTPGCAYLDECASVESADVKEILTENFDRSYNGNRAPMQINLQSRAFFNKDLMTDLKDFIEEVLEHDDVWFVTYQEALRWVQAPAMKSSVDSIFNCPKRKYNKKCGEDEDADNSTGRIRKDLRNPFVDILDTERLWIWQVLTFFLAYFLIYRYDKMQIEKAKRKVP